MNQLSLIRPDDWHVHLRDGPLLQHVVGYTARQFGRAIVMPNLSPPIVTVAQALDYRARIVAALPAASAFDPLMTLYLTDSTPVAEIESAAHEPQIAGCKLYPAGATTHSDAGVTRIANLWPVLEAMEKHDVPLLVHGEVTDPEVDVFDREKVFVDQELSRIVAGFPGLRVVLEHVTTREGVDFVKAASERVGATITPQHLLFNRNAMFAGGLRPHNYCLPVLKREPHRQALVEAAISGNAKFFLGTDSAPHARSRKEAACGCAGCFNAPSALELYATVFDRAGALDKLEGFASLNGPRFYGLPVNSERVTLLRSPSTVPDTVVTLDGGELVPFMAGAHLDWAIQADPCDFRA